MSDFQEIDGTERARFYWEGTTLHRVHDSLNEAQIMSENRALQAKTLGFGRMQLRMSYAQYVMLQRLFPDLKSGDAKERTRAWQKIARDLDYAGLRIGRDGG